MVLPISGPCKGLQQGPNIEKRWRRVVPELHPFGGGEGGKSESLATSPFPKLLGKPPVMNSLPQQSELTLFPSPQASFLRQWEIPKHDNGSGAQGSTFISLLAPEDNYKACIPQGKVIAAAKALLCRGSCARDRQRGGRGRFGKPWRQACSAGGKSRRGLKWCRTQAVGGFASPTPFLFATPADGACANIHGATIHQWVETDSQRIHQCA